MIDPRESALVTALALPADSLVNQRIPKKLLIESDAPTSADKRLLNEGIEEIYWVAALKPTIIGVPEFRSDEREYLEIAVVTVLLRSQAKAQRMTELVHRSIPYPVVLVAGQGEVFSLSLAHKRFSQAEGGKVVIEGVVAATDLRLIESSLPEMTAFLGSLSLSNQPGTDMYALYQGWIEKLEALAASRITGLYALAESADNATTRRAALEELARLQREVVGLRSIAAKEKQFSRRVELNIKIRTLEVKIQNTKKKI